MKKAILYFISLSIAFILPSCEDKLIEEPKSILTPDFFASKQGFESGLSAAYAGTRMLWGSQDLFTLTSIGTDEFQSGQDAGGNISINSYSSNYLTNNGIVTNIWRQCYIYINTCNGLIDNASKITGIDDATKNRMVAEAKFLRAQYYFILVQFFGDVTLNKTFQAIPSTSADRHPMADTYDFIIQDLLDAIAVLPAGPKDVQGGFTAGAGRANGAAAKHVLAKVYLTRAGSSAAQPTDNTNAYTIAMEVINNRTTLGLGLLADFDLIHNEGNENNIEVLWTVQHTTTLTHNGSTAQNSSGPDNVLNHMWVPQYEQFPGLVRSMDYGRPYIRCIPTLWNAQTAFADRTNDSRYQKTFQVAWISNADKGIPKWTQADATAGYTSAANVGKAKFAVGDTAIYMPGFDMPYAQVKSKRYLVLTPEGPLNGGKRDLNFAYGKRISPAMNKFFDTKRSNLNNPSIRPVIVYRLAETYLIAAEAAFKTGDITEAVNLINVVRARAARNAGAVANMTATTLADLTAKGIDYILDERTRELCGENVRWLDLVRTGKLLDRVRLYNPEASPNILDKHILRPIPQTQIDGVITGTPYPQNSGW